MPGARLRRRGILPVRRLLIVAALLWALPGGAVQNTAGTPAAPQAPDVPWFTDVASEAGLEVMHFNGMTGRFHYAELIAPGVALVDADNDGDLDVYAVQGQMLDETPLAKATFPPATAPRDRLFRNDLIVEANGSRRLRFTDVTAESGIDLRTYGMGIAAGDFDRDGWTDLYRTGLNGATLLRNGRDGTFIDVTEKSGTANRGAWSVSATFFDYDRDGWLDLFAGNYLQWSVALDRPCRGASGRRVYCAPAVYRAQRDRLYRNNRDGTFTDVTEAAGMSARYGPALGAVSADFNNDGWPDVYVANDGTENQLWINQRDGTFEDMGLISGTALGPFGHAKAGMGVDAADVDEDGDADLVVTNLAGEGHDYYINDGTGLFESRSAEAGILHQSLPYTGFGTAWLDVDNDGWLDLLTVNGAVQRGDAPDDGSDPFPLAQRSQLFRNRGDGRFEDATSRAGPAFAAPAVGRGAAFGDVDNDGDTDVLVASNSGPLRLLLNQVGTRNHWLGLDLIARDGTRAVGARVEMVRAGQTTRRRRARADGSYASANDPRVLIGLGTSTIAPTVRVTWPDGEIAEWRNLSIDRYTTLRQRMPKSP